MSYALQHVCCDPPLEKCARSYEKENRAVCSNYEIKTVTVQNVINMGNVCNKANVSVAVVVIVVIVIVFFGSLHTENDYCFMFSV